MACTIIYETLKDIYGHCKNCFKKKDYSKICNISLEDITHNSEIIYNGKFNNTIIYKKNKKVYKYFRPRSNIDNYISLINDISQIKSINLLTPYEINRLDDYLLETYSYHQMDLFTFIENRNTYFDADNLINQILNGVKNLHENNIAHRDLKPENILIKIEKENIILKIIDFDFSCKFNDNEYFQGGSKSYAAPELFGSNKSVLSWYKLDIWAVGIIIYILLFGYFPWNFADKEDLYYNEYVNNNKTQYWNNKIMSINTYNKNYNKYFTILYLTLSISIEDRPNIDILINNLIK